MSIQQLKTAVLLIAFNRPDNAQRVFNEIRKAKPARFFMAVDGPRENRPEEKSLCKTVRDIVKQVDWECEVKTLFQEENLGCGVGPSRAITWFFENVEEGIILEDDCVPHQSFFQFCQEMLEKYRDEEKVMVVSGDNFQSGKTRGNASYYFSIYPHIWGWATWRRAWKHFDFTVSSIPKSEIEAQIKSILKDKDAQNYWLEIFQKVHGGHRKDIWDYQWLCATWIHQGLTIIPNVNLVSNIGFGPDATHTNTPDPAITNIQTEEIHFPLLHPSGIEADKDADSFTLTALFRRKETPVKIIRRNVGKLIPHQIKKFIKNTF